MTIETTPRQSPITQTLRAGLRSKMFWIVVAIVAILFTVITTVLGGSTRLFANPLDPDNPAPGGTLGVAEVLRDQGVDVTRVTSLEQARDAVRDPAQTTLVLDDSERYLDEARLTQAATLANTVILLDPASPILDAIAPDIASAGSVDGVLTTDCALGAAERARTITAHGHGFRYLGDSPSAVECFASGDDVHSLIRINDGERSITVLGATAALSNETILEEGNAALTLGLLGENPSLIWYLPGPDDLDSEAAPTASDLTPGWVPSIALLAVLVTIAAGVWRGRRMGPLVVEKLPVTVPSTETMEGRARLYQRSSARVRALDSLRVGTVHRLAQRLHLPRTASVDDIAYATAALLGRPVTTIQTLLIDELPDHDRSLIELSDQLLLLERAVTDATTPR